MAEANRTHAERRPEWQAVKHILAIAIESPRADRSAYLDHACGLDQVLRREVDSLLLAHDEAGFTAVAPEAWLRTLDLSPGSTLGPYRVVQKLGEGGMGQVFAAQQESPIRRTVALKLIRPGMDSHGAVRRFATERQTLALMNHPNIAHVFDVGTSAAGRLYFAMEKVDGRSITEHCDAHALTARERIELFLPICHGVQHAHQKGIIHRDLKPSNVLVATIDGQPVPKIIDFGIAKAIQEQANPSVPQTEVGRLMGTPEYMSPEQTEPRALAVDTRSDVYSLGALLYELLTGLPPFDPRKLRRLELDALTKHLRDVEPPRPSRARELARRGAKRAPIHPSRLAGDLDWIVMRALAKDPSQRYASPAALADDLGRHLRSEPVSAGPPTIQYRLGKFVRRHRLGAGVTFVVALALVSGLGLAVLGLSRAVRAERVAQTQAAFARTEAERASHEAETAQHVSSFLLSLFGSSNPRMSERPAMTLREVLDAGATRVHEELDDRPVIQSRMMQTMGQAYHAIGLHETAKDLYEEALRLRTEAEGPASIGVSEILHNLGWLLLSLGDYEESRPIIERSVAIKEDALGPDHPRVAAGLHNLGLLFRNLGDFKQSRQTYERALRIREHAHGPEHLDVAMTLTGLGFLLAQIGDYETATVHLRRALTVQEKMSGVDHPELAFVLSNLSEVRGEVGDLQQARVYAERAYKLDLATYGPDHHYVALSLMILGRLEHKAGTHERAREHFTRAMTVFEKTLPPGHLRMAQVLENLAALDRTVGEVARAGQRYRQALEILEQLFGLDHPDIANILVALGELALEADDPEAARHLYARALNIRTSRLESDDPRVVDLQQALSALSEPVHTGRKPA